MIRVAATLVLFAGMALGAGPDDDPKSKGRDKAKANPDRMIDYVLKRFDKNADGKLSKSEAPERLKDGFAKLDTSKDGFLDKDELKALAKLAAGGKGKFAGKNRGAAAAPAVTDFNALDKDADGRLTRAEVKGTPFELSFDAADANKDGKVDSKEFAAYRKK